MRRFIFFKLIWLGLFLLPAGTLGDSGATMPAQLAGRVKGSNVLILGEKHGKPESTGLFVTLVDEATRGGECLTVALEISSDQQPTLDRAMNGHGSIAEIVVDPVIDHPGYREMLARLRGLKAKRRCLHVVAIDGIPGTIDRDTWMAEALEPHIAKGKVICLLGRLHSAKKIRWEDGRDRPFLAERLVAKGVLVCSVVQIWDGKGSDFIAPLTLEGVADALDPVAARLPEDAREFGDYVVRWK
ncbi:hypothetical protein [Trichloromonas sp.]|uniref:hypothetical protein n=1 Tax=Trichloromonas sp. TaxID=3069249 RepID=UPI002A41D730|nr:hypothetical protein [Trichloromonas sp.]